MSYIIAATDFSSISIHAVRYACELSSFLKTDLLVFNAFTVPMTFSDAPLPFLPMGESEKTAEESMNSLLISLRQDYPGIKIEGNVTYGDMAENLREIADESSLPLFIVLGNSNTGSDTHWLDSHMLDAFRHLKFPILAVPPDYLYKPVQKICFAYDNHPDGLDHAIGIMTSLIRLFGASLHILNAQSEVLNRDNMEEMEDSDLPGLSYLNPKFHYLFNVSTETGINNFINENEIDLLIIIPRHHSLLDNLIHRHHTRAIARHASIPILSIHE